MKRLMTRYLGEMEEDDLILFTLEHMKDHKGPKGLVEGLEPVSLPSRDCCRANANTNSTGPRRRRDRARHCPLAAGYIREYGVWGGAVDGSDDGR